MRVALVVLAALATSGPLAASAQTVPDLHIAASGLLNYWFNDGTGSGGADCLTPVEISLFVGDAEFVYEEAFGPGYLTSPTPTPYLYASQTATCAARASSSRPYPNPYYLTQRCTTYQTLDIAGNVYELGFWADCFSGWDIVRWTFRLEGGSVYYERNAEVWDRGHVSRAEGILIRL